MFDYLSRSLFICCLVVFWATPELVLSCINTSYSRKHEQQITGDLPRLISGQFSTHGDAFYEQQLVWTKRLLELQPEDFSSRIDRAAALLKLQRYAESEALLLEIEKDTPGRYKTHANLGVLYKKMGDFAKAIQHTERALEIKPEGHLGLGDYYLRMLQWKQDHPYPVAATVNFLGVSYEDGPAATANSPLANEEWLKTLIISDRHFHDVYWVLGDVLFEKGNLQNALRCYHRASALLEHTATYPEMQDIEKIGSAMLRARIGLIGDAFDRLAEEKKELVFDRHYEAQIASEISAANRWLTSFQRTESELLEDNETPDFDTVIAKMKEKGITEPKYLELGVYEGKEVDGDGSRNIVFETVFGVAAAAVVLVILVFLIFCSVSIIRFLRSRLAR